MWTLQNNLLDPFPNDQVPKDKSWWGGCRLAQNDKVPDKAVGHAGFPASHQT